MIHEMFSIYNGKEYSAGYMQDNLIVLRSHDPETLKLGFQLKIYEELNKKIYFKIVPCSEVSEMYSLRTMATYKGYDFYVYEERGDEIYIESQSNIDYRVAEEMGFEMVDRGIYGVWIKKDQAKLWIEKRYRNLE